MGSLMYAMFAYATCLITVGDVENSKDHAVLSRYPGSVIQWYNVDNHRPYRIPVGPVTGYRTIDKWIETEGRLTRIYYTLDNSKRTYSEVFKNYSEALSGAGFKILAQGEAPNSRGVAVGTLQWRHVLFQANPWGDTSGAINEMVRGSSSSGGGGTIIASKANDKGTAYVLVTVYQFREDRIAVLVDVVEVAPAELGRVVANAEAIGVGIAEHGRVVLDGILFDFDKATLQAASKPALEQIALFLKAHKDKRFYVVGHTDSKGSFAYNQGLAQDRARTVVETLVKDYGIGADRLEPHGVGPLAPIMSNGSDRGRDKNRRVELVEQ